MTSFVSQLHWIEANFHEVMENSEVVLHMKYATNNNFMGVNIYEGFRRCFLAPYAFLMFAKACEDLRHRHPHLQFVIWDSLRPRSIQKKFYEHLEGSEFQNYVAAPQPGSLHNFGMAIDLTLQTRDGKWLDMGTDFDDFRELAQPRLEKQFLQSGELSKEQWQNRLLLRNILEGQGFKVLDHEWWHFNALPKESVYEKFPVLE